MECYRDYKRTISFLFCFGPEDLSPREIREKSVISHKKYLLIDYAMVGQWMQGEKFVIYL